MTRLMIVRILTVGAALLATVQPAAAQDAPKADLSVGYQFLRIEGANLPKGWYADVAINKPRRWSAVIELAHTLQTQRSPPRPNGSISYRQNRTLVLGGARITSRRTRVTVFAQALAGLSHTTNSCGCNDLALQFGAGFSARMSGRLALRATGDYVHVNKYFFGENVFRFTAGLAIPLARR